MNANELADKLEQKALTADAMEYGFEVDFEEAATMLRQQQAEIEALKAGKIRAYNNGVEDGRKPNTNLVKELTDEEIKEAKRDALKEYYSVLSYQDEFELSWIDELFARAILRKAQDERK